MGQLAVGLGGAALSSAFGFNPAFGFVAGTFVGGLLFPPDPVRIEGPRRSDLKVTSSTHGRPIPEGFGVIRMSGNMIWSSGIREVQTTTEVGGKGGLGGPTQEQVRYTYFADCSFAFAQGPAEAILRIWADGKLITDVRDPATTGGVLTALFKPGLTLRTYLGTETQARCPTIEAAEGADNTPAYRGTVYLTLENFELTDFGNRIPQITAEIAFKASGTDSGRNSVDAGVLFDRHHIFPDYKRNIAYSFDADNTGTDGIRVWDLSTLVETRSVPLSQIGSIVSDWSTSFAYLVSPVTGRIYVTTGGNSTEIEIIDPDSLTVIGSVGTKDGDLDFQHGTFNDDPAQPDIAHPTDNMVEATCLAPTVSGGAQTTKIFLLVHGAVTDGPYLLDVTDPANTLGVVWDNLPAPVTGSLRGVAEPASFGTAVIWMLHDPGSGNDTKTLQKWEIAFNARLINVAPNEFTFQGVTRTQAATFDSSLWGNAGAAELAPLGPVYDLTDGNLMFAKNMNGDRMAVWKWNKTLGQIQWNLIIDNMAYTDGDGVNYSRVRNGRWGITNGRGGPSRYVIIDTIAGELLVHETDMEASFGAWWNMDGWFWDDTANCFTSIAQGTFGNPELEQFCVGRFVGQGEPLSDVVALLSGENVNGAGLPAGDYDVSQLVADTVRGYAVTRQMPVRRAIEPLMAAYDFDATEADDKVRFVKRGGAPVATITQADIVAAAEPVRETRTQEVELPERLDLGHIDPAFDYQENMATAKRVRAPIPTMFSLDSQSLDLAIVFTATEAKDIAERLLYTAWSQRTRLSFRLSDRHVRLVPSDVVTLTLDSGSTFNLRITKADIAIDHTQAYEAVVQEQTLQLSANPVADPSLGFEAPELPQSGLARLCLIDAPYLRDVDATGRNAIELKYGMAGFTAGWQAGSLWQSNDGFDYSWIGRSVGAKTYGIVTDKLPAGYQNLTDTVTTLRVAMVEGDLQSVTDAQFEANEQVAIIGSPATQRWEYVAYRDAVEAPAGIWTVSHLRRGRRGTDAPEITDAHQVGELFIVAERAAIDRILLDLAQLNVTRFYRGVGRDSFLEEAETHALASRGRPLMPFRPYQLSAALDGGSNIDFAWRRSNRLSFELTNAASWNNGPLDEDTEAYEVDVLAGPGGAVVRTLAATAEAVQYANADIITDFGAVPAAITFIVYQMSAQVGRGYASAETTITL